MLQNALIETIKQDTGGRVHISHQTATHIINIVQKGARLHVIQKYRWSALLSKYELIRTILVAPETATEVFLRQSGQRPVHQEYYYEYKDDKDQPLGKIFTISGHLFD